MPGYGDVLQVLAAGRTSVVVDPTFNPTFYQLAGYRILGRRAVRVDILERLADLIRNAVNWKPGSGPRPDGAYDGRHFLVTPAMMSILGATAEDMEEILKSLGYRFDKKDKAEIDAKLQELDATKDEAKPAAVVERPAEPVGDFATTSVVEEAAATEEVKTPDAEPVGPHFGKKTTEEEEKPVLLWHYQGRHDYRQSRQNGDRKKRSAQRFEKSGERTDKSGEPRRDKQRPRKNSSFNNPKADASYRQHKSKSQPKPIDPDSPFAKLAALRDQLKK